MTEPMHDFLAAAIDRRTRAFAQGRDFADAHRGRVLRSIRARRAATYAGTGTTLAAVTVGAVLGVAALAHTSLSLFPVGHPSPDPSTTAPAITPEAPSLATQFRTTLVPVEIDESSYPAGEKSRSYVFYASLGATDAVPFPASGIWYPGIPDVPADALIVAVNGNASGYNLEARDAPVPGIGAFPAWTNLYDMVGNRDADAPQRAAAGHNASINWDVIGDVSDHTLWGVHYFLLNGEVVTEVEGRANPDAIEVTAMIANRRTPPVGPDLATPLETTLVQVPSNETIWPDGDTYRYYGFYATAGATDTIPFPFPASGSFQPGFETLPSDAVLVDVDGDVGGFDLVAPHANLRQIWASSARTNEGMDGGLDGADSGFDWLGYGDLASWDVIGDVTDHTRWAVHYFLVKGEVVTEIEGRANPDAIEVTAWFDPASFAPTP